MKVKIEKKSKLTITNPKSPDDKIDIVIVQPSIANKSKQYVEYLNNILDSDANKSWYYNIVKKFMITQDDDIIYKEFLDKIIDISVVYFDKMKKVIPFDSFVNRKKKTSNSILFDEKEVEEIYLLSTIIKLYSIVSGTNLVDSNVDKINKKSFEYIIQKMNLKDTINKIHHVVYTKLFKCVGLDPTIMKTIALRSTMSEDDFVLYLFDYVLSAILVIYDMIRNPITFIVTSVDQVMVWHYRGLYQKSIAYKETGELFGKSLSSTNLPDRIISDKIYEYVQNYVSLKNKENGIIIDENCDQILDRHFYNFFVMPLYSKLFNIKKVDDYNTFQKINIQLYLYYTMKDYVDLNGGKLFPRVDVEKLKDKNNFENYKLLEILKRLPVASDNRYKITTTDIFEDDEFMIDSSLRTNRNYMGFQYNNSYKIECLSEILTSDFKFYGINNIMILNNYLKTVMNVLTSLTFKNLFTFDLTKIEFKAKKFSKQLELEIFPFLMVILNNKMPFFDDYSKYISNMYCINRNLGGIK